MENYIVINGKKAELTIEQLKQLGIKTPKNLWIKQPWLTREGESCWACPKCKVVISSSKLLLEISHTYCGACGHKNIEE